MADIKVELEEYMKKNNVQDFLNNIVLKIVEHKPANPLFYLHIQNVVSKEKNEKARILLECHYDLMVYRGRPETEKNILPDLFHKLSHLEPGSFQDNPTVAMKFIEKLTMMMLIDFPINAIKLVIKKIVEGYDEPLEYEQFESVIDTLLGLLNFFDEFKAYYDELNDRPEGVGPEIFKDLCQLIEKSKEENIVMLNLKNLLERSELTFDLKKFGVFADVIMQLLEQAL